jgi:hypothetical protein
MRYLRFSWVALAACLAACSTSAPVTTSTVTAPTSAVLANTTLSAESALTTAEVLAGDYVRLPVCPTAQPVCSDIAVSAKLKALGAQGDAALVQVKAGNADAQTVLSLASQLTAMVPPTPAQ